VSPASRAVVALVAWLGLAACVGLAACGSVPLVSGAQGVISRGGPVKVGLVDVFSGSPAYAALGPALQNSLQVEIDDLNAHGGLLGARLQLVTADDQYNPAVAPDVVRRLLADRSVRLLVGPSFAGLYLGAKPVVELNRVPNCLTSMAADDVMRSAPFSFRAQAPDRASVPALLAYIQRSTPLKKVGLVTDEDSAGQDTDRQLSDQAGRTGLQYIGAAFAGAGDQKAQVQQMLQRGAEAVVLSGNPATAARTLQAIRAAKAGAKLKAFGFSALGSYTFAQQAGDAASGLTFASTIQQYLSDVPETRWPPAYRTFVKSVLARYGPAQNGVQINGVPAAADCVLQWARAVQTANDFDGIKVARAWETLDVPAAESVLGVREQFTPADHDAVPADSLFVYQWTRTGDRWTLKQLAGPTG
jgi:branched-chain amino acid transport system substrate-binding protein